MAENGGLDECEVLSLPLIYQNFRRFEGFGEVLGEPRESREDSREFQQVPSLKAGANLQNQLPTDPIPRANMAHPHFQIQPPTDPIPHSLHSDLIPL